MNEWNYSSVFLLDRNETQWRLLNLCSFYDSSLKKKQKTKIVILFLRKWSELSPTSFPYTPKYESSLQTLIVSLWIYLIKCLENHLRQNSFTSMKHIWFFFSLSSLSELLMSSYLLIYNMSRHATLCFISSIKSV